MEEQIWNLETEQEKDKWLFGMDATDTHCQLVFFCVATKMLR